MRNRFIQALLAIFVAVAVLSAPARAHAEEVTVMAVGDILPHPSWIPFEIPASKLFGEVMPTFFYGDVVIGNLETPLTDKTEPTPVKSPASIELKRNFVFKTESPDTAQTMRDAGITVLTLANNHILDYREEGLVDTIGHLEAAGIKYAGAGLDSKKAAKPALLDIAGMEVAVLAASDVVPEGFAADKKKPGIVSMKNAGSFMKLIRKARKDNPDALLVLSLHWGVEATLTPSDRQKTLARKFIDAGADLIVGHHPHRIQGVEFYKGRPIFYSLGNFVFDSNPPGDQSFIAKVVYDPSSDTHVPTRVGVIPVRIEKGGTPIPLKDSDPIREEILGLVKELSEQFGTSVKGDVLAPPAKGKPGKYDYWGV